jgi:hypothetical protein
LAQKSSSQTSETQPNHLWWVVPAVIGGCILAIVFAYLHVRLGTTPAPLAAAMVVANIAIFLGTYFIFRQFNIGHNSSSMMGLLISTLVAVPVFAIAFFGLGYEISELADIGAMYILGTWIGSSEAAERAQAEQ